MSQRSLTKTPGAPKAFSALRSPPGPLAILATALLWLWQPSGGGAVAGDGAVKSQIDDALSRGRDAYHLGDFAAAIAAWRKAAETGSAPAMTELGWMYEKGQGTSRDYTAAAKWYLEAWGRAARSGPPTGCRSSTKTVLASRRTELLRSSGTRWRAAARQCAAAERKRFGNRLRSKLTKLNGLDSAN